MSTKMTRRDFLKMAGITGAAGALGLYSPGTLRLLAQGVDPSTLIDASLLPGSPTHARGWTTHLPALPEGFPLNPVRTFRTWAKVGDMQFIGGDTLENNPWSRMVEPLTGIHWEYVFTAGGGDEEQQKWQLAMASGDIPDVADSVQPEIFKQLLDADQLEDITDLWEEYASPEIKTLLADPAYWRGVTKDGRKYGLPTIETAGGSEPLLWIRQDWLEQVGMEVPTTLEELEAVAQAFIDAKLGGENTVGINASNALTSWLNDLSGVMGAFGARTRYGEAPAFVERDGMLVSSSIQPEVKEALALLRRWYEMGILRQDFFQVDSGTATDVVGGNQCGIFFGPFWAPNWPIPDSITNSNGTARWIFAQTPAGPRGVGKYGTLGVNPMATVFRKGFDGIPEVLKYINWFYELSTYADEDRIRMHGWENFTYEWVEGDRVQLTGINAEWFTWCTLLYAANYDPDAFLKQVAIVNKWLDLPADQLDAWQEMKLQDPAGNAQQLRDAYTLVGETSAQVRIASLFTGMATESMAIYLATLNPLEDSVFFGIITGERPLDDFDQFVTDWLAGGGQQITDEVNAWWAEVQNS